MQNHFWRSRFKVVVGFLCHSLNRPLLSPKAILNKWGKKRTAQLLDALWTKISGSFVRHFPALSLFVQIQNAEKFPSKSDGKIQF